jgi:hypothetical protein
LTKSFIFFILRASVMNRNWDISSVVLDFRVALIITTPATVKSAI